MIEIRDAEFIKSAAKMDQTLLEDLNEVAFIGRSNVGKSSIINALTNRKGLAKKSSTPGKTRLINFFNITFVKNDEKYLARLVDLPGFGYARVSKSMKKEWQQTLTTYVSKRMSIRVFVNLRDSRHPDLDIDNDVQEYLKEICREDQKVINIFTKSDKLKQKDVSALKKIHKDALLVSNTNLKGIQNARDRIFEGLFGVKID